MLSNIPNKTKVDDIKILFMIILGFIFLAWNIVCWGNQLNQLMFMCCKIQHTYFVLTRNDAAFEYKYHRNSAVLYTKMNDKAKAYSEINLAFDKLPRYTEKNVIDGLYRDKALIEAYFGDYKSALSDYVKIENSLSTLDKCKIGILFKLIGNKKYAVSYCTDALQDDNSYYLAWACVADVYASAGKFNVAVKLYDFFIDQAAVSKSARYFADRAYYKKKMGDNDGYEDDMAVAYQKNPTIKEGVPIIDEALSPKAFNLIPNA